MDTLRERTRPIEYPEPEPAERAIATILRGEDVLEEAREVAQKISGRVSQAVTRRQLSDGGSPERR